VARSIEKKNSCDLQSCRKSGNRSASNQAPTANEQTACVDKFTGVSMGTAKNNQQKPPTVSLFFVVFPKDRSSRFDSRHTPHTPHIHTRHKTHPPLDEKARQKSVAKASQREKKNLPIACPRLVRALSVRRLCAVMRCVRFRVCVRVCQHSRDGCQRVDNRKKNFCLGFFLFFLFSLFSLSVSDSP